MNAIARIRFASRAAITLIALGLTACTETIREVPATDSSSTQLAEDGTNRFVTSDEEPVGIEGFPGSVVDCEISLPCSWLSSDGGLTVTASRVENSGATGGLEIDYRVRATRATAVSLGGNSTATDASGAVLVPSSRELDGSRGQVPVDIAVARSIHGSVGYAEAATIGLTSWSISLLDNGFAREAVFLNLPVGRAESVPGECEFKLPCTWISADGLATVTLTVAGGLIGESRLSVGVEIETVTDLQLALDGTTAIGEDGTRFQSRLMSLGTNSHYELVTAESIAEIALGAHVDFLRVATQPMSLKELTLDLYRDEPVPRWDISFRDVPLGASTN